MKTRLYQFNNLLKRIKLHLKQQNYKEDELIVLAGDLNVDSNEKPYKLTEKSYLRRLPVLDKTKVEEQESVGHLHVPT